MNVGEMGIADLFKHRSMAPMQAILLSVLCQLFTGKTNSDAFG